MRAQKVGAALAPAVGFALEAAASQKAVVVVVVVGFAIAERVVVALHFVAASSKGSANGASGSTVVAEIAAVADGRMGEQIAERRAGCPVLHLLPPPWLPLSASAHCTGFAVETQQLGNRLAVS